LVQRNGTLFSPNGTWSFEELKKDPFELISLSQDQGHIILNGLEPEKIVSALLLPDGAISNIYLGDFENREPVKAAPASNSLWHFQSSGSTGKPKNISQDLSSISRQSSKSISGLTWGFLTQITRMAGIQVAIEALASDSNLVAVLPHQSLGKKIDFFSTFGVNSLSATPSQWRNVLSHPQSKTLKLSQLTLGGEVADQKILDALRSHFPDSRITHVYATTETGPVFSVSDGLEGFPARKLSGGHARIILSDDGELGVKTKGRDHVHWTGDIVEQNGERIVFRGRKGTQINVGGVDVLPQYVERILLQHPLISDCVVYGSRNSILGELVACDLVLASELANPVEQIRQWAREKLQRHEQPRVYRVVSELSMSNAGKKERL
jgi:acyl-coenzyme A synthetase/AMP-(fatty) acid ligase